MSNSSASPISSTWGFLNGDACSTVLPSAFDEIVHTSKQMGCLLREGSFRSYFDAASPLEIPSNLTGSQYRLLWTVYGMLTSAYVFSVYEADDARVVPRSLAIPLFKLSKVLGMPPILNYDAYVYNNFRLVDTSSSSVDKPEGYTPLFTFSADGDEEHEGEKWFIVVHVAAERRIGPSIAKLSAMQQHLENGEDSETVAEYFSELSEGLDDMAAIISRMQERLSPESYAFTTRQYVFPFNGVIFEGVEELNGEPQFLRGETGGQSPVPRAVAAFVGLQHSSIDMAELGEHMLPEHRQYIQEL